MVDMTLHPASARVPKAAPDAAAEADAANEPWHQERIVQPDWRGVRFLWQPVFLERAFVQADGLGLRGAEKSTPGSTVLADIFLMDDNAFSIEAQLFEAKPNRYRLHLHLLAPPDGDGQPGVVLKWGTEERRAVFRNGVATIENLPPMHPKPKRPNAPVPEFSVTLEFKQD